VKDYTPIGMCWLKGKCRVFKEIWLYEVFHQLIIVCNMAINMMMMMMMMMINGKGGRISIKLITTRTGTCSLKAKHYSQTIWYIIVVNCHFYESKHRKLLHRKPRRDGRCCRRLSGQHKHCRNPTSRILIRQLLQGPER